jgi:hypothetical protein
MRWNGRKEGRTQGQDDVIVLDHKVRIYIILFSALSDVIGNRRTNGTQPSTMMSHQPGSELSTFPS